MRFLCTFLFFIHKPHVYWSCDHYYYYIHCTLPFYIWWWWCYFSSPTFTCVVSFLALYTCFFMYAIFIYVSHMMPWWVLFKCFRKIGCESLSCDELSSCKVFQEFLVGINFLCNTTNGYEFSDLRLLSWFFFFFLWFCHGLLKREIVRDIFDVIG